MAKRDPNTKEEIKKEEINTPINEPATTIIKSDVNAASECLEKELLVVDEDSNVKELEQLKEKLRENLIRLGIGITDSMISHGRCVHGVNDFQAVTTLCQLYQCI